ncbi:MULTISPECIES: OB-fold putative lipoprotein [Haemophilus]|uniref:tRNA_anti-like n=1 Tax=Haemophilus aegyptius TaxID=197575 RepID=A0ABY1VTV2_HAEAE|nr:MULTISPECIES: OB-fold putative lipoprotein [Haemophilus]SQH36334.1 tRNA_anti-like [Haemophilus aegyptius]VEH52504.1 tRNA_anti-like [Haemophilus aegyptius]
MKKAVLSSLILVALPFSTLTEDKIYNPSPQEIELMKLVIKEEIDVYFQGGKTAYKYGDYVFTTISELEKEYDKNEARANKKFKGKNLIVSGTIGSIETDLFDHPYIVFKSKNEFNFNATQAKFKKSAYDKVIDLNKSDKVNLVCEGAGEVAGTPMLDNCQFRADVIKSITDQYLADYNNLLTKGVDTSKVFLNKIVYIVARRAYITNGFSKCSKKITSDCLDKGVDKKKEKAIEDAAENNDFIPELKPLAEYLDFHYTPKDQRNNQ